MTSEKNHWVKFLPEVGRPIIQMAQDQIDICEKIKQLYLEIQSLERQHDFGKSALLQAVTKHWSNAEIAIAEKHFASENNARK